MRFSRRTLLKTGVLVGSSLPLLGCEKLISEVSKEFGQTIPDSLQTANQMEIDDEFHLLSRAAYGGWPGELEEVKSIGAEQWITQQLSPETIDDSLCDLRARRFETIWHAPGTCYEYKKTVLREEIARHTLLRAVYSRRQLFEVMVNFWTDHLNINLEKGDCIYLKPSDDRQVIRAHALGKFRDLIRASATSPAMLVYLDGTENKKASPDDVPNENYARELLELHTLGVHGGYTQSDVYEVARCLTGWRLRTRWRKGTVYFDPQLHDDGEKQVLGHTITAGGGERDLEEVIDRVCTHPATARNIALKLVRRFVADAPPSSLVDRVATVFTETDGDIKSLLRAILLSNEFSASRGQKLKRPFHFVVSSLRLVGADTHAHQPLIEYLNRMGQGLFQHPTPDGYPDEAQPWLGTLLWRWNFAFALVSEQTPAVSVPLRQLIDAIGGQGTEPITAAKLFPHFVGRAATAVELAAFDRYVNSPTIAPESQAELIGLMLASPAFQRC